MNTSRRSQISLLLACLFISTGLAAEPLLNGLAVSKELGKERFIAALYSDNLSSDADAILNSSGERRMELKITDKLSARSLNSMWIEGIAINNRSAALEEQAENLASLTNMVRKRLLAGDTLRFDASRGNGTTVTLNGVKLGNIPSDDFFPILLRTWIGRVPLSSDFKSGLLSNGDLEDGLASRYRAISPDPTRVDLVASWSPTAAAPKVASTQSSASIAPPPPSVSVRPPAPTLRPSELARPTIEAMRDQNPPPKVATIVNKPAMDAPNTSKPIVVDTAKPVTTPKPTDKPTDKPKATDKPKVEVASNKPSQTPLPPLDEEEEEEEVFSASSLLDRQYYVSDSMMAIQKSVSYPRRAIERNQQGSVRLAVTVDRQGKLKNVQTVEESRYTLLNKAAISAVEKAMPLAELPKGVSGDTFTFTVPITFAVK